MSIKDWYGQQDATIKATVITAVITGVLGVVAAVVISVSSIINAVIDHPGQGASQHAGARHSAISTTTQQPSLTCAPSIKLTYPPNGKVIGNGAGGVNIKGTACGLGDNSAWLFEWDSEDKYYYADYNGSGPSPLNLPTQGSWHFEDKPIGNPGDDQKEYILTLVLASTACNQALLQASTIISDGRILHLPTECRIVDQRDVYVSYTQ
jgi:hypothetical protein